MSETITEALVPDETPPPEHPTSEIGVVEFIRNLPTDDAYLFVQQLKGVWARHEVERIAGGAYQLPCDCLNYRFGDYTQAYNEYLTAKALRDGARQ